MANFIARAMMGDRKAQKECTNRGILLRCPFCGSIPRIFGKYCISYVHCDNCGAEICVSDDTEIEGEEVRFKKEWPSYYAQMKWNTRFGPYWKCKDCANKEKATENAKGFLICPASGMEITDEDFCSYFETKPDWKELAPLQPIEGLGSDEGALENCAPGVEPERSGK